MQYGNPTALPQQIPTLALLKRRIRNLSLLCVLAVLLAVPAVWAGYFLGGKVQPGDAQTTMIWSYAAAGALLVLFLLALFFTLRARKALKDTVRIQEELTTRIDTLRKGPASVPAPEEASQPAGGPTA